jgi:hypothetical protein
LSISSLSMSLKECEWLAPLRGSGEPLLLR